jgi:hypothetical protein
VIPLMTTTISVRRPDRTGDKYDPQSPPVLLATGIRAGITNDTGTTVLVGGTRTEYTKVLNCDPTDIKPGDIVQDDNTGDNYRVNWATLRQGLGLDHINGRLRLIEGAF